MLDPIAANLSEAKLGVLPGTPDRARAAAEKFEAFFLTQFVDLMMLSLPTDGMFGGGYSEKIFRSMLSEQYAAQLGGAGGFGLADQVQREILKMQEV